FGPYHGQSNRKTCDATPSGLEAPLFESLHFGRTRRMVGHDEVNHAIAKSLPELFAVRPVANGRSTLTKRSSVSNVLGRKDEIVGAGFHGDRQTFGFGAA